MSVGFGRYDFDPAHGTITFHIDRSSVLESGGPHGRLNTDHRFATGSMVIKHLPLLAGVLIAPLAASAQARKQVPLPAAQGTFANVSGAVWAGNTLYLSGWLDPALETHTDIKSQTVGAYKDIEKFLESQKLTLGDVVMIHAYIGSEAEHAGYSAGYNEIFGADQPNKPAHTLLQVVLPAARRGALVEIDVIAVRPN